jgi:hypothetical protein
MSAPLYKTTDTHLASFLLSQGFAPVSWRRLTPKKVLFRFEADEGLHSLLRLYWSGQPILIAPVGLFAALRKLKSRTLVRMGADLLHQAAADAAQADACYSDPGTESESDDEPEFGGMQDEGDSNPSRAIHSPEDHAEPR